MTGLYFGDIFSIITLVLVLGMAAFIVLAIRNGAKVSKWGRWIALFILVGIAISALSATRDAYMTPNALIGANSWQAMVCMTCGGAIVLTGIVSIFFKKKQNVKRQCFHIISALFIIQVLTIEISRPVLLMGGAA